MCLGMRKLQQIEVVFDVVFYFEKDDVGFYFFVMGWVEIVNDVVLVWCESWYSVEQCNEFYLVFLDDMVLIWVCVIWFEVIMLNVEVSEDFWCLQVFVVFEFGGC